MIEFAGLENRPQQGANVVMEPTFRVGDLAVYPAHGVAQIVGIETREISGNKQTFYILKILENGMKIMIPTRNAGAVGLRELIRADEVDEVFEILKSREVAVEGQTWNRRYREYMEKIKTGSVFEIAEVQGSEDRREVGPHLLRLSIRPMGA
jgi:CarD family transcriptional regulator